MYYASFFRLLSNDSFIFRCFAIRDVSFAIFRFGAGFFTTDLYRLFRVDAFQRALYKIRGFTTTSKDSPRACVMKVFRFHRIYFRTVFFRVISFMITTRYRVTYRHSSLSVQDRRRRYRIRTSLIISNSYKAINSHVDASLIYVTNSYRHLGGAFQASKSQVDAIARCVSRSRVFRTLFVVFFYCIGYRVFDYPWLVNIFFILFRLFFTRATYINADYVRFVSFFLNRVRGDGEYVRSSTGYSCCFFLRFMCLC